MRRRIRQRVIALQNLRKRQYRQLRHAQRNVKIPQADVRVDAQHALSFCGEAGGDRGADRGLSRSALAGDNGNHFSHILASLPNFSFIV